MLQIAQKEHKAVVASQKEEQAKASKLREVRTRRAVAPVTRSLESVTKLGALQEHGALKRRYEKVRSSGGNSDTLLEEELRVTKARLKCSVEPTMWKEVIIASPNCYHMFR
jgi:hypothetical protein